jgi:Rab-GTPase-TBC domain
MEPPDSPNGLKWKRMMYRGIKVSMRQNPDTFQRRARRGIPEEFRWDVWKACVDYDAHFRPGAFEKLSQIKNKWSPLIAIDVPRTFTDSNHTLDSKRLTGIELQSLERILIAYSNLNTEVGYCQGMNFIVGLLLLVSKNEEEVFWFFVCLMEFDGLNGFFKDGFPRLGLFVSAFDQLLDIEVPSLRQHFININVQPSVYIHQWYLTLFINTLPLQTVLVIWDSLMCDGLPVIVSVTVTLLQVLRDVLIKMDFEEVIRFFKSMKTGEEQFDAAMIGRLLVRHSGEIVIPPAMLKLLRSNPNAKDLPDLSSYHDLPEYQKKRSSDSTDSWLSWVNEGLESFRSSISGNSPLNNT